MEVKEELKAQQTKVLEETCDPVALAILRLVKAVDSLHDMLTSIEMGVADIGTRLRRIEREINP